MSYYIYEVHYCGVLVYIGMGQGDRTDHVCSGSSHNKFLNEVYYRNQILGEPKAEVRIRKRFKTKLEATKSEKWFIGKLNPLFNNQHTKPYNAVLFSPDERDKLLGVGDDFLAAVDVFDDMCFHGRVNPKFSLTPIGALMWGVPSQWGGVCSNLAGLSLIGKCEQIQDYFDWVFVGDGVVKVWLKTCIMREVVDRLDSGHYIFQVMQKPTGMPNINYGDFKPNGFGSIVPSEYWVHKKQGLVLCRTIGKRSRVKLVLSLYDTDGGYKVVCENSQQLVYESRVIGDALNVYRRSELKGKEFVLLEDGFSTPICQINLSHVVDFDTPFHCAESNDLPSEFEHTVPSRPADGSVYHPDECVYDQLQMPETVWDGLGESDVGI